MNNNKLMFMTDVSGGLAYRKFLIDDKVHQESYGNKAFAVLFWTLLYCPKDLDLLKCLKMAMFYSIHNYRVKNAFENDYIVTEEIAEKLNKPEILWIYEEFIEQKTLEAKFVYSVVKAEQVFHLSYLKKEKRIGKDVFVKFFDEVMNCKISEPIKKVLNNLGEIDEIAKLVCRTKNVDRAGFNVRLNKVKKNGERQYKTIFLKGLYETDGDHIFGLCLLLYLLDDKSVDLLTCLSTAILHDIPEGKKGIDYTPMCDTKGDKEEHELEVMTWFADICERPDFLELFNSYNANKISSFIRVKSADKLEFLLKTIFYWKCNMFPLAEVKDIYQNYKQLFGGKIKDLKIVNCFTSISANVIN